MIDRSSVKPTGSPRARRSVGASKPDPECGQPPTCDAPLGPRDASERAFFDQDPAMAEKARRKTYDMLVADKLQVQGFHYPFPGLGNIVKDGSGYRLVPAQWSSVI